MNIFSSAEKGQKQYLRAREALKEGRIDTAIELYEFAMELGNEKALRDLAEIYISDDAHRDLKKAESLLLQEIENKVPTGYRDIGELYLRYPDVFSVEKGVKYLEQGYAEGDDVCMELLGDYYGSGTGSDKGKAMECYKKASKNNLTKETAIKMARLTQKSDPKTSARYYGRFPEEKEACRFLFKAYLMGLGTDRDMKKAAAWLRLSDVEDHPEFLTGSDTLTAIGDLYRDGWILNPLERQLQVTPGKAAKIGTARRFYATAAARGSVTAPSKWKAVSAAGSHMEQDRLDEAALTPAIQDFLTSLKENEKDPPDMKSLADQIPEDFAEED